jgi:hypothetical protein
VRESKIKREDARSKLRSKWICAPRFEICEWRKRKRERERERQRERDRERETERQRLTKP